MSSVRKSSIVAAILIFALLSLGETQQAFRSGPVLFSYAASSPNLTTSTPVIDYGQLAALSASWSGTPSELILLENSTAPSCTWSSNEVDSTYPSSNATTHTFSEGPSSNSYYCVGEIVSGGQGPISNAVQITVNPPLNYPNVGSLCGPEYGCASVDLDSGQNASLVVLSPGITGGTPPYSCIWLSEAPGSSKYTDLTSFNCSSSVAAGPLTNGIWQFELEITDSASVPKSLNSTSFSVTVNPALVPATISVDKSSIQYGDFSTLSIVTSPSGGTPYLSCEFFISSDFLSWSDFSSINCNAQSSYSTGVLSIGNWYFKLQTNDSSGIPEIVDSNVVEVAVLNLTSTTATTSSSTTTIAFTNTTSQNPIIISSITSQTTTSSESSSASMNQSSSQHSSFVSTTSQSNSFPIIQAVPDLVLASTLLGAVVFLLLAGSRTIRIRTAAILILILVLGGFVGYTQLNNIIPKSGTTSNQSTNLLAGALFYNGTVPAPSLVSYKLSNGTTTSLYAISGWVLILTNSSVPLESVESIVSDNGGSLLSYIPRAGLYLSSSGTSNESSFIANINSSPFVEYAIPDPIAIRAPASGPPIVLDSMNRGNAIASAVENANSKVVVVIVDDFSQSQAHGFEVAKSLDAASSSKLSYIEVQDQASSGVLDVYNSIYAILAAIEGAQAGNKNIVINWSAYGECPSIYCTAQQQQMAWFTVEDLLLTELAPLSWVRAGHVILTQAAGNQKMDISSSLSDLNGNYVTGPVLRNSMMVCGMLNDDGTMTSAVSNYGVSTGTADSPQVIFTKPAMTSLDTYTSYAAPICAADATILWNSYPTLNGRQVLQSFYNTFGAAEGPASNPDAGVSTLNLTGALSATQAKFTTSSSFMSTTLQPITSTTQSGSGVPNISGKYSAYVLEYANQSYQCIVNASVTLTITQDGRSIGAVWSQIISGYQDGNGFYCQQFLIDEGQSASINLVGNLTGSPYSTDYLLNLQASSGTYTLSINAIPSSNGQYYPDFSGKDANGYLALSQYCTGSVPPTDNSCPSPYSYVNTWYIGSAF